MTAAPACRACGTEPREGARFCDGCGAPFTAHDPHAEYKQVTVLFADVVHSMDIASAVGAERLREIMADLANRCAAVVQRYGGTVDKFTGDGIMAVFGAPVALEDHAIRACLAALAIQEEVKRLADEVRARDTVDLRLRVGLNSGQVIAGEIGSGPFGYTAVGEQVGMAQRMESAAPPGGVILSASTARLVEGGAALGEPEMVHIKGAKEPVIAHRLRGIGDRRRASERAESSLVGRRWEMSGVEGLLRRALAGYGEVVAFVGPPGIGKSRLVREVSAMAGSRGMQVFTAFCESHTSQVPFQAVTRLLRAAFGIEGLDGQTARDRVRDRVPDADTEDLALFDDLLGIADPGTPLPAIDPDARRRRVTSLVNAASLAREAPAVYVVEDAHWIDQVSESMLVEFLTVIPRTPSLVVITYRPEYEGALSRVAGAETVSLAPLSDLETTELITGLLGHDPSVAQLGETISQRAAGNPFFAEEMVRELAERGVLRGHPGSYLSSTEGAEVSVPATLQAAIAARIDRLDPKAKRTLNAAAVVGSRFGLHHLSALGVEPVVGDLVAGQLIDQVSFSSNAEYVFLHPLIRSVAYESQLKADRTRMHRCLAEAIEAGDPASADENAALIAEHFEAAGDLHAAFSWHMRAGAWLTHRDVAAARASWQRARLVADRLLDTDPQRAAMRIAPRTMLCATAFMAGGSMADTGYYELRELTDSTGDKTSLAVGMAGWITALVVHARFREASRLASELADLLDSIGDPALTLGLLYCVVVAKYQAGEMAETLVFAQRVIDLADGDPRRGNLIVSSPLAGAILLRGCARCCLGDQRWRGDVGESAAIVRAFDGRMRALLLLIKCGLTINNGVLRPDEMAQQETAEVLGMVERSADRYALDCARYAHGITLVAHYGPHHADGLALLRAAREAALQEQFTRMAATLVGTHLAAAESGAGNLDGAIELSWDALEDEMASGEKLFLGRVTFFLVEALLRRGSDTDLRDAQSAIDQLAAMPIEPGFVMYEIWLLRMRALMARARGDEAGYREYRDRYRDMAKTLGFEGHIAWAGAMP